MARAAAALFVAIGALVILSMLVSYPTETDRTATAIAAGASALIGLVLLVCANRLGLFVVHCAILGASLEICLFVYLSGVSAGVYAIMFTWVALVAAFFFPGRIATGHIAFVLAAYALTLAGVENDILGPLSRWLLTAVTLAVTAGVTSWLVYGLRAGAMREEQLRADAEVLARTDELTGLPNRRWLRDELEREMARSRRQGFEIWAAVIDLDHFKAFNDRFGHLEGDNMLRQAGDDWRSVLRVSDFLARAGGEEFVLLLPDCSRPVALEVIERMRDVTPKEQTFSAGLARWDGIEPAEELLDRADRSLYEAKRSGRDRTEVAEPSPLASDLMPLAVPLPQTSSAI